MDARDRAFYTKIIRDERIMRGHGFGKWPDHDELVRYGMVEREEWTADGSWIGVMEIPAGLITEITDKLKHKTKGSASVKLIN